MTAEAALEYLLMDPHARIDHRVANHQAKEGTMLSWWNTVKAQFSVDEPVQKFVEREKLLAMTSGGQVVETTARQWYEPEPEPEFFDTSRMVQLGALYHAVGNGDFLASSKAILEMLPEIRTRAGRNDEPVAVLYKANNGRNEAKRQGFITLQDAHAVSRFLRERRRKIAQPSLQDLREQAGWTLSDAAWKKRHWRLKKWGLLSTEPAPRYVDGKYGGVIQVIPWQSFRSILQAEQELARAYRRGLNPSEVAHVLDKNPVVVHGFIQRRVKKSLLSPRDLNYGMAKQASNVFDFEDLVEQNVLPRSMHVYDRLPYRTLKAHIVEEMSEGTRNMLTQEICECIGAPYERGQIREEILLQIQARCESAPPESFSSLVKEIASNSPSSMFEISRSALKARLSPAEYNFLCGAIKLQVSDADLPVSRATAARTMLHEFHRVIEGYNPEELDFKDWATTYARGFALKHNFAQL
ncbi:MAG: hypothetical protein OXR66_01790 [Candidatus Woesearchaeota archaeon]|nr:hypothetical protein [Candidatus Woesearchaeota archaeon]